MPTEYQEKPKPPSFVSRLDDFAQKAFRKLCSSRCDPETLAGHFEWLEEQVTLPSGLKIRLNDLDSWETAFPGLTRRQVERDIPKRAEKLQQEVLLLEESPVVDYLVVTRHIGSRDLLSRSPFPLQALPPKPFGGLLLLPKIAKKVGSRRHSILTRHLAALCRYVRDCTGGWRDPEVACILASRFRDRPNLPKDAEELGRWRRRNGLRDQPRRGDRARP